MKPLERISTARDNWDTTCAIVDRAARFLCDFPSEHDCDDGTPIIVTPKDAFAERDRLLAEARGCDPRTAKRRIRVIDRAWKIAEQHRRGGPHFELVVEAIQALPEW